MDRAGVRKPIDPVETENAIELMEQELSAKARRKLDRIAARRAGVENSLEWLATIEAITRLEQEIEALQLQLRPSP